MRFHAEEGTRSASLQAEISRYSVFLLECSRRRVTAVYRPSSSRWSFVESSQSSRGVNITPSKRRYTAITEPPRNQSAEHQSIIAPTIINTAPRRVSATSTRLIQLVLDESTKHNNAPASRSCPRSTAP